MAGHDALALRLASLVLAFSNTHTPLSTDTLHRDYYPDQTRRTFYAQFRRDRERLVLYGFVIREAGTELWEVDRASFADSLDVDQILTLVLTCAPLMQDANFPYREELRHALAKIDSSFDSSALVSAVGNAVPQASKTRALLNARAHHHAVQVTYQNARGERYDRTLAIYGEFGFRNHVYFVACELFSDGTTDQPKLYRDDRFRKVNPQPKLTYTIPEDFCADDYRFLAFQIGSTPFEAELEVPTQLSEPACEALERTGSVVQWEQGYNSPDLSTTLESTSSTHTRPSTNSHRIWRIEAADVESLAIWAIAEGFVPLSPTSLVDTWKARLLEACHE